MTKPKIELKKKPKNSIIIDGFPGFGLVGTIATEFLIDHLETERIGSIWLPEMPSMVAIHEGELVHPIGIFYSKKYNLMILHCITSSQGIEWDLADGLLKIARDLDAKEIISLEGVGSPSQGDEPQTFYHTNNEKRHKQLKKQKGVQRLTEGIIMGVTSALLLRGEDVPIVALFAEARSRLPDSKAAAKLIQTLDGYQTLDVETDPLMDQAEKLEGKLKNILQQSKKAEQERQKKELSYVG